VAWGGPGYRAGARLTPGPAAPVTRADGRGRSEAVALFRRTGPGRADPRFALDGQAGPGGGRRAGGRRAGRDGPLAIELGGGGAGWEALGRWAGPCLDRIGGPVRGLLTGGGSAGGRAGSGRWSAHRWSGVSYPAAGGATKRRVCSGWCVSVPGGLLTLEAGPRLVAGAGAPVAVVCCGWWDCSAGWSPRPPPRVRMGGPGNVDALETPGRGLRGRGCWAGAGEADGGRGPAGWPGHARWRVG